MMINLAARCPDCGQWTGVNTNDPNKASLICKTCGKATKLRVNNKCYTWNVQYKLLPHKVAMKDLVSGLNMRDRTNEEKR